MSKAHEAISNMTKADPAYWSATLKSRLADGTGSRTNFTSKFALHKTLLTSTWEPYEHLALSADTPAFITKDIPGHVAGVPIHPEGLYTLEDPKATGKASAILVGPAQLRPVDFTVLICGYEDGELRAFTFHPGDPVRPSEVPTEDITQARIYRGTSLLEMGLTHAKIGGEPC